MYDMSVLTTLSSFSTLALVMVMLGLLSWPGDAPGVRLMHMVGSESDLPDTLDVKFDLTLSQVFFFGNLP